MNHRPRSCCLIFLVVLAVAAAGIWLFLRLGPYQSAAKISPEMAGFLGKPDEVVERLRYRDTPYGKVGQYKADLKTGETAYFDVDKDKKVTGYFLTGQHAGSVAVQKEQAIATARKFALQHYPDEALLNEPPETASLVSSQEDARYYEIAWVKRDAATNALLPQSAQVQVNAQTGAIIGYQRVYLENLPAVAANVTKDAASETSTKTMQQYFDQPEVVEADLLLTTIPMNDPKGVLKSVWQVHVRGTSDMPEVVPEAVVLIDAVTGKVIEIIPME